MSDNVLSSFTPTRREERAYDHTFRVGIIGTGWIAEAHAESYLNQPDVKIVALADLIPGKAEAFAKCYYCFHTIVLLKRPTYSRLRILAVMAG